MSTVLVQVANKTVREYVTREPELSEVQVELVDVADARRFHMNREEAHALATGWLQQQATLMMPSEMQTSFMETMMQTVDVEAKQRGESRRYTITDLIRDERFACLDEGTILVMAWEASGETIVPQDRAQATAILVARERGLSWLRERYEAAFPEEFLQRLEALEAKPEVTR